MIITDIIALAKAGYTPKDIRELFELANDTSDTSTPVEPAEEGSGEETTPDPEPQPGKPEQPEKPEKGKDDTKVFDLEAHAEIKRLKEQIQRMQEEAIKQDISDKKSKSDADTFAEIMRAYM